MSRDTKGGSLAAMAANVGRVVLSSGLKSLSSPAAAHKVQYMPSELFSHTTPQALAYMPDERSKSSEEVTLTCECRPRTIQGGNTKPLAKNIKSSSLLHKGARPARPMATVSKDVLGSARVGFQKKSVTPKKVSGKSNHIPGMSKQKGAGSSSGLELKLPHKVTITSKLANPEIVFELATGEGICIENGCIKMMDSRVRLDVTTKNGLGGGILRTLSGGTMYLNVAFNSGPDKVQVVAAPKLPGDIYEIDMQTGDELLIAKHGVLAFTPNVDMQSGIKLSGMLLSGAFFQKLRCKKGPGKAWIASFGDIQLHRLTASQNIRVDHSYFVCCPSELQYSVKTMTGDESTGQKLLNFFKSNNSRLAMQFQGPGLLMTQSRSLDGLVEHISEVIAADLNR